MRVLFYPLNEYGHVLPTFQLAHALAARGHEVVYACGLDLRSEIERRGFRCAPLHRDVLPLGTLAQLDRMSANERAFAIRMQTARIGLEALQGWTEQQLREIAPAVALVDTIQFIAPFVFHRAGIPMLRLATSLSARLDELPPITSSLPPDAPLLEVDAERAETRAMLAQRPLLYAMDAFSARCGYPAADVSFDSAMTPFLRTYREVVLCASSFDFPRHHSEAPTYFPFPPELDRVEDVPDALQRFCAVNTTPLIYVSVGTQSGRYVHAPSIFRALLQLLRDRPDWRAVIATGDTLGDDEMFSSTPPNVLALRRAPQIYLLRHAAVFITHAGLGSVREAIALRVPMLAIPQGFDQPGNAARITWHEIGITVDASAATSAVLERRIARLLDDRELYRSRLARLDEACRAEMARCAAVDIIEQTAAAHPYRSPPSRSLPTPAFADGAPQLAWVFGRDDGTHSDGGVLTTTTPPEHGVAGFTACAELGDALDCAVGSVIARVEISGGTHASGPQLVGSTIRCLWVADATAVLLEFADWCTDLALEPERHDDAENVMALLAGIRSVRSLRATGAPRDQLRLAFTALQPIKHVWHRGYDLLLRAHAMRAPHDVARCARTTMLRQLARRAAGPLAGTAAGSERYEAQFRAATDRSNAELHRRIMAIATAAGPRDVVTRRTC
jgi:zeaxanthin glucosyltransferase